VGYHSLKLIPNNGDVALLCSFAGEDVEDDFDDFRDNFRDDFEESEEEEDEVVFRKPVGKKEKIKKIKSPKAVKAEGNGYSPWVGITQMAFGVAGGGVTKKKAKKMGLIGSKKGKKEKGKKGQRGETKTPPS
jgi:hypothetical protein